MQYLKVGLEQRQWAPHQTLGEFLGQLNTIKTPCSIKNKDPMVRATAM